MKTVRPYAVAALAAAILVGSLTSEAPAPPIEGSTQEPTDDSKRISGIETAVVFGNAGWRIGRANAIHPLANSARIPRDREVELVYTPGTSLEPFVLQVVWNGRRVREDLKGSYTWSEEFSPGSHTLSLEVFADDGFGMQTVRRDYVIEVPHVDPNELEIELLYPSTLGRPPLDLNGDFVVNVTDLEEFWSIFGTKRGDGTFREFADWNGNGEVDLADFVDYLGAFQTWSVTDTGPDYGDGTVFPITVRPRLDDYAFSVPQPVFHAATQPAGYEEWIDWSIDGAGMHTGAVFSRPFSESGHYEITGSIAGSDDAVFSRTLTIYQARITNFTTNADELVAGVDYRFLAETEPPGYEDYVNWYATTAVGTAYPARGRGATFDVRFDGVWREDGDNQSTWLGVQADNDYFNQDSKIPGGGDLFVEQIDGTAARGAQDWAVSGSQSTTTGQGLDSPFLLLDDDTGAVACSETLTGCRGTRSCAGIITTQGAMPIVTKSWIECGGPVTTVTTVELDACRGTATGDVPLVFNGGLLCGPTYQWSYVGTGDVSISGCGTVTVNPGSSSGVGTVTCRYTDPATGTLVILRCTIFIEANP